MIAISRFSRDNENTILEILFLRTVFAERFNLINTDLLKRPVFEKGDGNWVDILPKITKQYNIRVHSSTKLSPIQASVKNNERYVYHNLLEKRKKVKPKFQVEHLIRTANSKKIFSKRDTTNWSYKLYEITKIIIDTIPSYRIDSLKERYNEPLLKKTELTIKETKIL